MMEQLDDRGIGRITTRLARRNEGGRALLENLGFERTSDDGLWTEWSKAI
jgi:RimJ/RimL family protein N-acetyltransferase